MKHVDRFERLVARCRSRAKKLAWGVRTVGLTATAGGVVRLAVLRARRPASAVARLRSGASLAFDYPSQLAPALVVFGDLIDPEYEFLRRVARPDWTVIDAGAAIGQFTIFAARLPCAVVHAFEPSPANVRSLRRNVDINAVSDRVVVHELALGAVSSEARFVTSPNAFLSAVDADRETPVAAAEITVVPVRPLGERLRELGIGHADVLKVNVAGFEPDVLAGAQDFLDDLRADVLILLIGRQSLEAYRRLAGNGYRFFFFHPVHGVLHEARRFDETFLVARPWPARHVIGLSPRAVAGVTRAGIELSRSLDQEAVEDELGAPIER